MAGEPDDPFAMIEPVVPSRHRWLARLLDVRPSDRMVDLGCGTGASLVEVAAEMDGCEPGKRRGLLVGVDFSAAALHQTGDALAPVLAVDAAPPLLVQADLKRRLPFPDEAFDRVLSHNVLECLPDPAAMVAEAGRVLRPDGRLVLSHSDFDTLLFASEDLALTRRLVRTYCDTQQPWMDAVDGTIGRRLGAIAGRGGLAVHDVQAQVVVSRRFAPGELSWGYAHNLAATLQDSGRADPEELEGWLAGLRRLNAAGEFLFSLNDYAVVCGRIAQ
jgi:SAM-dependent methyltransferase